MKIIVDENIEFGQEAFEQFGEVILSHGRKITNEMLKDAFALIVRSITSVNEELLKGTNVKFVGTATIGTDHLDIEYLDLAKIMHSSAPGCNSFAVTEYVLTALSKISYEQNFNLEDKSLGVIGYGNIGKKITSFAKAIGMNVAVNDPPLEREGFDYDFSTLEEALECDIITLHVPLNKTGIDKTYHLLDEERINNLKPGTILINTSRGAVVDNIALLNRLKNKNDITVVLDVWENEPSINQELLQNVFLGTQHIAGYSYEGKVNGTVMIYESLCEFLNEEKTWQPKLKQVDYNKISLAKEEAENLLYSITNKIYPIQQDSQTLKSYAELNTAELAKQFDLLRKNYKLRREFNNYFIQTDNLTVQQKSILEKLRFNFV
jgi:erythronate-4-phosphate dehydrogenase